MASKIYCLIFFALLCNSVQSATLFERSYEYVMNVGKNLAPSFISILDCFGGDDAWVCAKEKAGKMLDTFDQEVQKQKMIWADHADAEVRSSGRSFEALPSQLGREIELSVTGVADLIEKGVARALSKKDETISKTTPTRSTNKKIIKKKEKPSKPHTVQPASEIKPADEDPGVGRLQSWVVGNSSNRGFLSDIWSVGDNAIDTVAEHVMKNENDENGIVDRSSLEEQRGKKKKKKKKAILKLLILGAVLKAKIGTLLQILSFKLQVKFFIIALIGLAINLARFWIELKNKHKEQPQKVIYYEHAQHQHHYEHEEEPGWGGAWGRSGEPEEPEAEAAVNNSPYRAYERRAPPLPARPLLTLS